MGVDRPLDKLAQYGWWNIKTRVKAGQTLDVARTEPRTESGEDKIADFSKILVIWLAFSSCCQEVLSIFVS